MVAETVLIDITAGTSSKSLGQARVTADYTLRAKLYRNFQVVFAKELPALPLFVPVYTYGVLLATAYLTGLWLAVQRARARGLNGDRVMDLGIWIIAAALIGAKLLLLAVDFKYYSQNPAELLSVFRSGGVFYGGLIAAVAVAFWYMRRARLPLWPTTDAFAPGIALGHVVGRFGCLMAGCCYGKPSSGAWAVTFTSPLAAENVGTRSYLEARRLGDAQHSRRGVCQRNIFIECLNDP